MFKNGCIPWQTVSSVKERIITNSFLCLEQAHNQLLRNVKWIGMNVMRCPCRWCQQMQYHENLLDLFWKGDLWLSLVFQEPEQIYFFELYTTTWINYRRLRGPLKLDSRMQNSSSRIAIWILFILRSSRFCATCNTCMPTQRTAWCFGHRSH